MAGSSTSKVVSIMLLVPIGAFLWFAAPFVMPVWRWRHMDFEQLSASTKIPIALLRQEYQVSMRYNPRGDNDPCPWQVITMDPSWFSLDERRRDEDHLLCRCTFISDRDGTPPSKFFLGSGSYKDRYWKGKAWRFPSGSWGFNKHRPVVVYRGDSFEHWDMANCQVLDADCTGFGVEKFENDDYIDDGFSK
jgi:hypothetical protein